ncbi:hypothetical protein [Paenibacillus sp. 22594]|uniref:hypothetical protein n=1 Tax=Paenibacillus sp. 22594 TaxID=3453947 RepID=UPI003F849831
MATLGQSLTVPQTGWRRFSFDDSAIGYIGSWTKDSSIKANYEFTDNKSMMSTVVGDTLTFSFTGTKLLIKAYANTDTSGFSMKIDGQSVGNIKTNYSVIRTAVVYESTSLSLGLHTVVVTVLDKTLFTGSILTRLFLDCIDIDTEGDLMAYVTPVGSTIPGPDIGWRRYNAPHPMVSLAGTWIQLSGANNYNNTYTASNTQGDSYSFSFKGTRVRLIAYSSSAAPVTTNSAQVIIDGKDIGLVSFRTAETVYQALLYEKQGLADTNHTIQIINKASGSYLILDAIDVDIDGRLTHRDEVFDVKDLTVGKRIRCNYIAAPNAVGSFSRLGVETAAFLPSASTSTPSGDFYWIMVEDRNGQKRLIADRNLQAYISWDTLNAAGIASGSGLPISILNNTSYMENNNLPVGFITAASSSYSTSYDAWTTFSKGSENDGSGWNSSYSISTGWLSYEFPEPRRIIGYSLMPRYRAASPDVNHISQMAKSWTFEGLNGNQWVVLDTQQGHIWTQGQKKGFTFENINSYTKYRINITDNGSPTYGIAIGRMELLEAAYTNWAFTTRLISGGTSSADKENEWDRYIVGSTLNGTITAGDNSVWNAFNGGNGFYTWTSTTSVSSTTRNRRGGGTLIVHNEQSTSYSDINCNFRPVLLIDSSLTPINLYLFEDGSDIKSYANGAWEIVGSAPVTKDMYETSGMTDLSLLTDDSLKSLTSNTPILHYWTNTESPSKQLKVSCIPPAKLVLATGDIHCRYTAGIDSFTLTAEQFGGGIVKVIASADGGSSWKTYENNTWQLIDVTNLPEVRSSGMLPTDFNKVPSERWADLILTEEGIAGRVRFGYYLEIEGANDKASTDTLVSRVNMSGKWVAAAHGVVYDYEYPSNCTLRVLLYADGTYKINY